MTMSHLPYQSATFNQDSDDAMLARVVAEIGELMAQGAAIDQDVYLKRYPEFADRLGSLWPVLRATAERDDSDQPGSRTGELVRADHCEPCEESSRTLGDFRLIREIGRGRMGIVYEAQQISLRRRVALEVLTAAGCIDDRRLQRFQIEARAAAALHHPNIVPVFTVATERRVPFYAMQFIEGVSLAAVIGEMRRFDGLEQTGPATACALTRSLLAGQFAPITTQGSHSDVVDAEPKITLSYPAGGTPILARPGARNRGFVRTVAALGVQAASTLEHAHQRGILHRDIKPSNLLRDEAGDLWVTDFGLARVRGETTLTQTGDMLGTLRYMSPESAAGRGKRSFLDGRTDIYSLGVTLYELLTLCPAFSGDDRVEVLRKIAQDEPTPPRKLDATIPIDLETIVLKAMAKAPPDRYVTADDLAADLGRFLDNRPILARRPSMAHIAAKWIRRHRGLVATAAGAAALIAVALAFAGWRYTVLLRAHNAALEASVAKAKRDLEVASRQRLADRHHFTSILHRAEQAVESREFENAQDLLDSIAHSSWTGQVRDFPWHYVRRLARRELVRLPPGKAQPIAMTLAPDARSLPTINHDRRATLWDLGLELSRSTFPIPAQHLAPSSGGRVVYGLRFSADTTRRGKILVYDTTSSHVLRRPLAPGQTEGSHPPGTLPSPHASRSPDPGISQERDCVRAWRSRPAGPAS
jgi:serine/threonine protein kinase